MKHSKLVPITFLFFVYASYLIAGSYTTAEILASEHFSIAPSPFLCSQLQLSKCQSISDLYFDLITKGDDKKALEVQAILIKEKLMYHLANLSARKVDNEIRYVFVYSLRSNESNSIVLKRIAAELADFKLPYRAIRNKANGVAKYQFKYSVKKPHNISATIGCSYDEYASRTVNDLFKKKLESIANEYDHIEFELVVQLVNKPRYTYDVALF